MLTISRKFDFAAAHYLPDYDGPCSRVHGHNYELEVIVAGTPVQTGPKAGMILDFSILKKVVEEKILSRLDHENLNKFFSNPTTEIICQWMFFDLKPEIEALGKSERHPRQANGDIKLVSVKLSESPDKTNAEFSEG